MNENFNIPLSQAVQRMNNELVQSVRASTLDAPFRIETAMNRLAGHISKATIPELLLGDWFLSRQVPRMSPADIGNQTAEEAAYAHYLQFLKSHPEWAVRNSRPHQRLLGMSLQGSVAIQKKHGIVVTEDEVLAGPEPLVKVWNRARKKRHLLQRAMATTVYLAAQTRFQKSPDCGEIADFDCGHLQRYFFQEAHLYECDELKVAILLGGEALERTRQKILPDAPVEGATIGQYLENARAMPAYFDQDSHQSFGGRLKEYARPWD